VPREPFEAIPVIFDHEGDGGGRAVRGDPGSFTRWGITAAKLGEWRRLGRSATHEEVAALARDEACAICRAKYWRPLYEQIRSQLVALETRIHPA
jgi:lysozyme family protein